MKLLNYSIYFIQMYCSFFVFVFCFIYLLFRESFFFFQCGRKIYLNKCLSFLDYPNIVENKKEYVSWLVGISSIIHFYYKM